MNNKSSDARSSANLVETSVGTTALKAVMKYSPSDKSIIHSTFSPFTMQALDLAQYNEHTQQATVAHRINFVICIISAGNRRDSVICGSRRIVQRRLVRYINQSEVRLEQVCLLHQRCSVEPSQCVKTNLPSNNTMQSINGGVVG
jgi:hypothetical protein